LILIENFPDNYVFFPKVQQAFSWFFLNSIDSQRSFLAVNLRCRNWERVPFKWRQLAIVGAEWADWAEWVPQLANPLLAIHYAKAATVVRINSKRDWDQHKQVKCKNRVTSFWSGQNYGHLVIVQSYAAETTAMTTVSGGCYMLHSGPPSFGPTVIGKREKCFLFSLSLLPATKTATGPQENSFAFAPCRQHRKCY